MLLSITGRMSGARCHWPSALGSRRIRSRRIRSRRISSALGSRRIRSRPVSRRPAARPTTLIRCTQSTKDKAQRIKHKGSSNGHSLRGPLLGGQTTCGFSYPVVDTRADRPLGFRRLSRSRRGTCTRRGAPALTLGWTAHMAGRFELPSQQEPSRWTVTVLVLLGRSFHGGRSCVPPVYRRYY